MNFDFVKQTIKNSLNSIQRERGSIDTEIKIREDKISELKLERDELVKREQELQLFLSSMNLGAVIPKVRVPYIPIPDIFHAMSLLGAESAKKSLEEKILNTPR